MGAALGRWAGVLWASLSELAERQTLIRLQAASQSLRHQTHGLREGRTGLGRAWAGLGPWAGRIALLSDLWGTCTLHSDPDQACSHSLQAPTAAVKETTVGSTPFLEIPHEEF